ncbi:flagellar protein FlgN [Desulfococcus sp.]|uniref:flagellar protein FlgN n=1 Tax=Desulfococcus sp. TaxID=2025834 RepID=UPI003593E968
MPLTMNAKETKLLDRFIGIVEEEAGLYARMPAILQREKRAVADADRVALSRTLAEKETLITLIQSIEEQRIEMHAAFSDILGRSRERLTLRRIAGQLPEPHASRMKAAGEKLAALIRRIQDANRTNRGLIEHHLELVQGAITFFERVRKPHQVYHRTGELKPVRTTGRVFSGKI